MTLDQVQVTQSEMASRLVRYIDLRPCTTAFIDTYTPGSKRKENFTIIGPGVAENPEQHVHISIPHGFNIGAARQPPACVNSQHSHETAEVFIVHQGRWRFTTGHDRAGPSIDLWPGDTISIPTQVFRGFENIGDDIGFMFAVLGGDDPGRVTWAPYVFKSAEQYGLVLLENGRLIDSSRESVPSNVRRMPVTTQADVAEHPTIDAQALERCVMRGSDLRAAGGLSAIKGFDECPIVGVANPAEKMPAGRINWPHHFQVRALRLASGAHSAAHRRSEEEVLLVHEGRIAFEWPGGCLEIAAGDTLTVPKNLERSFFNPTGRDAVAYVVRGGNHPEPARFSQNGPN